MIIARGARSRRLVRTAIAVAAIGLAAPAAASADVYLVQLKDEPLAAYTGGKKGIPATSPQVTGRKLKVDSAPGLDYRSYLANRQQAVLDRLHGARPDVVYSYRYALAGFAADLSTGQADALKKDPAVAGVWQDRRLHPDQADGSPDARLGGPFGDGAAYLRLTDDTTGLWKRLGGPTAANGAGSGVIFGDIDTGIQPGHPSFADVPSKGYVGARYSPPAVWDGACQAGDGFSTSDCNNKLIGARYYVDGFGKGNLDPKSFLSPRDDDGHGTHTASTAAGNYGVDPSIDGNDLGVDVISGIAPRAYVAAYKVCWNGNPPKPAGCSTADIIAAINQAVADGVDVINMSLGSDTPTIFGAEENALLNAAAAGVFVANSAGNAGPGAGTVGSPSSVPWTTAVGADTLHRAFTSTVTITRPDETFTIKGASVTNALASSPLVDAANAAVAGATSAAAALCQDGTLDPAKVAGKVVLCLRGSNARINKSHNVARAGGVGMILYNASDAQDLDTDTHWVPSAHVNNTDGRRVKDAIARGGASASLTAGTVDTTARNRVMAAFSSRGPELPVPDIMKPDVVAPGVQILAGAADQPAPSTELRPGQLFQAIQGTSMAAPHVAGAGILLTQAHPTLSPAEIKSELMTTANADVVKEDATTPATPFDRGAGEIDPNRAADSGLVLDVTYSDYVRYLASVAPQFVTPGTPKLRPSDLNLPSIAFSRFVASDATTRTFTSVDSTASRWTASVQAPPGMTGSVDTPFFTIKPGQSQAVRVTLRQVNAPLDQYGFGALVLTSGSRTLRLPIAVKPTKLATPATVPVTTAAASGTQDLTLQAGYSGTLSAVGYGLGAPQLNAGRTIRATSGNPDPSGADPGSQVYPLTAPAGSQLISARVSNVDAGDPSTDLDLFLYYDRNNDGKFTSDERVAASASAIANEAINYAFPAAGKYEVVVVGFATRPAGTVYDLTNWVVSDPSPDDLSNTPAISVTGDPVTVSPAGPATLKLNWAGVAAKGLYLGVVTYHDSAAPASANQIGYSIVELSKTADTSPAAVRPDSESTAPPVDGTPPSGSAPASGGAPAPKAAWSVKAAALHGRVLTLRLAGADGARVRASVKRGAKFVARSTARKVTGTAVRLTLSHRLRPGRYTVKVIVSGRTATVALHV